MPVELLAEIDKACSEYGYVVRSLNYKEPKFQNGKELREQLDFTILKQEGVK